MKSASPFDASPSDVDLFAIFDTTDRLVKPYRKATLQPSSMHTHFTLMLRVKSMCCSATGRCRPGTPCSSENLARDGILLYARGFLPTPLAA